jgi:hypothetical protein
VFWYGTLGPEVDGLLLVLARQKAAVPLPMADARAIDDPLAELESIHWRLGPDLESGLETREDAFQRRHSGRLIQLLQVEKDSQPVLLFADRLAVLWSLISTPLIRPLRAGRTEPG